MKAFFDTSSLIKNYIEEDGSERVSQIILQANEIIIALISRIEFVSAMQRLKNTGFLLSEDYNIALSEFYEDSKDFELIAFDLHLENLSIELSKKYGLRTLDSIQLASCVTSNMDVFITSDEKLFLAAREEFGEDKIEFI